VEFSHYWYFEPKLKPHLRVCRCEFGIIIILVVLLLDLISIRPTVCINSTENVVMIIVS